jgi:DNA-nicking Smr family endonuclease
VTGQLSHDDRALLRRLARTLDRPHRARQSHRRPHDPAFAIPDTAAARKAEAESFATLLGQPAPLPQPDATPAAKCATPPPVRPVPPSAPKLTTAPPVHNRGAERRVRRGHVELSGRLDLHGCRAEEALGVLATFVQTQRERNGGGAVLVITGKGRGGTSVLRQSLPLWLDGPACRPHVSAFAQAHPRHGGAGAWYVFLRPFVGSFAGPGGG